jgi:3-hydroxymyristoyl/3-hydroxydecanoyl-(acyl carrier protein) dehydratase/predicted hotdog family 3-hydroxylacyl-ACP dehydratase
MSAAGRAGFRFLRLEAGASRQGRPVSVAEVEVPADSPFFAGHFPGHPVLPGIAHLALLQLAVDELASHGGLAAQGDLAATAALVEVRHLRLRRIVAPGDRLELRIEPAGEEGVLHFELRLPASGGEGSRGAVASQGTVRAGAASAQITQACPPAASSATTTSSAAPARATSPATAARARALAAETRAAAPAAQPRATTAPAALTPVPAGPPSSQTASFPPPATLLPHAPPARLLTEILAASATGIIATGAIPAGHPLVTAGEVPGFVALELAAQAAAALQALLHPAGAPTPRIGYLVGVRAAHLAPTLPAGRILRVTALPAGAAATLTLYEMELVLEGNRLARGTVSTFLTDKPSIPSARSALPPAIPR